RVVVKLAGELDMLLSPSVAGRLHEIAEDGNDVVVDLSDARFIDSTMLEAFVTAQKDLEAHHHALAVVAPGAYARRTFELTGLRVEEKSIGQHTRLWARVLVLGEGDKKIALVAGDLNAWPGGLLKQAAEMDKDLGYSEQNVVASASHTHAAPTGFYNFGTYNTVFMTAQKPTEFKITDTAADPQLYTFMVKQVAAAIRRADADLAPAELGWGIQQILGLTANRSIEAHLADFGIHVAYGQGSPMMDPGGYPDTIDPEVNVLRVDQLKDGRRVPIGIWSTFADHGTVNKYTFNYYNEDHHGAATSVVEKTIRRLGHVPRRQDVVNVYGNSDEGDQS